MNMTSAQDSSSLVSVSNISKYFEIYRKPSDRLLQMIWRGKKTFYEPFWALRDVSFSVGQGECLGIVGRNGAGKSTLLQILAGTLRPSSGQVSVNGRVAALLELGSGFNPDYTGRENIWLNASLLGLTEAEIDQRFDAIAAFADIGAFIDQPVKSYSSGMSLRLAFSVIAHIDADILIIDEALAVGDAFFTQKCMRFMRNFIAEKAAIFVSHDVGAVNSLCSRAILLENGAVKRHDEPKKVIETYLKDLYEEQQGASGQEDGKEDAQAPIHFIEAKNLDIVAQGAAIEQIRPHIAEIFLIKMNGCLGNDIEVFRFNENGDSFGKKGAVIIDAYLLDAQNRPLHWLVGGEMVKLDVSVRVDTCLYSPIIGFHVRNRYGQQLFGDNTFIPYRDHPVMAQPGQILKARFAFIMPILEAGDYSISIAVAEGSQTSHVQHDWKHEAILFRSTSTSCQTGMMGIPMREISLAVAQ